MFLDVSQRDSFRSRHSSEPSERELREMLEETDRRKEVELQRKSRVMSFVIGIPTLAFVVWGAGVYLENRAAPPPVASKAPVSVAVPAQVDDCRDIAELDHFRPKAMQAGSSPATAQNPKEFEMVDRDDIEFAMQLMNYCQSPVPKEKKK
jgi:hypothetical protein